MASEIVPQTMSMQEAARYTGYSVYYIKREIRRGRIKKASMGRNIRIRKEQLDSYMQAVERGAFNE